MPQHGRDGKFLKDAPLDENTPGIDVDNAAVLETKYNSLRETTGPVRLPVDNQGRLARGMRPVECKQALLGSDPKEEQCYFMVNPGQFREAPDTFSDLQMKFGEENVRMFKRPDGSNITDSGDLVALIKRSEYEKLTVKPVERMAQKHNSELIDDGRNELLREHREGEMTISAAEAFARSQARQHHADGIIGPTSNISQKDALGAIDNPRHPLYKRMAEEQDQASGRVDIPNDSEWAKIARGGRTTGFHPVTNAGIGDATPKTIQQKRAAAAAGGR